MSKIVISGSGVYTPPDSISNEELSASYNSYAAKYNEGREKEIAAGETAPLKGSGAQFIFNASGIRSRYVVDKTGILDPERMRPRLREYSDEGVSIQAGMGERAARQALEAAEIVPGDIDALIVACTAVERLYPPVSVEIQKLLGARGFAFDLQAACSSMAFRHSDGKGHDQRRERQEGASHKPGDMHGARLFQGQRDPLPLRGRRGGGSDGEGRRIELPGRVRGTRNQDLHPIFGHGEQPLRLPERGIRRYETAGAVLHSGREEAFQGDRTTGLRVHPLAPRGIGFKRFGTQASLAPPGEQPHKQAHMHKGVG